MNTTQMIDDTVEFFEGLPAFSFVFFAPGVANAIGPNLMSGVELAVCTFNGRPYDGPFPESEFRSQMAEAERRRTEIVESVKKCLRRLRKLGVRFIMSWQAVGEDEPHLDHSRDYEVADIRRELVGPLHNELLCQVVI